MAIILLLVGSILIRHFYQNDTTGVLVAIEVISGVGAGAGQLLPIALILKRFAQTRQAVLIALLMTTQLLGSTLGFTIGAKLIQTEVQDYLRNSTFPLVMQGRLCKDLPMYYLWKADLTTIEQQIAVRTLPKATGNVYLVAIIASIAALLLTIHLGRWQS